MRPCGEVIERIGGRADPATTDDWECPARRSVRHCSECAWSNQRARARAARVRFGRKPTGDPLTERRSAPASAAAPANCAGPTTSGDTLTISGSSVLSRAASMKRVDSSSELSQRLPPSASLDTVRSNSYASAPTRSARDSRRAINLPSDGRSAATSEIAIAQGAARHAAPWRSISGRWPSLITTL